MFFCFVFSITPLLPGPDLIYKAYLFYILLKSYYNDNNTFKVSRTRAGHNSIILKNPEMTGTPASPELAMAGRHNESPLGINQS
mgnify:CR=1 FL=1